MENYTVFICDDKVKDRNKVNKLLVQYGTTHRCTFEVAEYSSGDVLVCEIKEGQVPDIIFLDINMEKMDGIKAAKEIRGVLPDVPIVLVTAYINYALEGYKVKASRFLVKDDLEDTVTECLDSIRTEIKKESREREFSFVEGKIRLKLDDIIYVETNAHVQVFHVGDFTYRIYKKLEDVENELAPYGFARVHKSFVVNLKYVTKISSYRMYLSTGKELSIPRDRYNEVKSRHALYKGGSL